jgi:hypothetical protein
MAMNAPLDLPAIRALNKQNLDAVPDREEIVFKYAGFYLLIGMKHDPRAVLEVSKTPNATSGTIAVTRDKSKQGGTLTVKRGKGGFLNPEVVRSEMKQITNMNVKIV